MIVIHTGPAVRFIYASLSNSFIICSVERVYSSYLKIKNLENDQPWNYVWNYNNSDMQDKVQYFYPCVCVCVDRSVY